MNTHDAIVAFSQCEKIKSGLIWLSQSLNFLPGLSEPAKPGAEQVLKALLGMIANEIQIIRRHNKDEFWQKTEKKLEVAMVMMNSGVPQEAGYHISQALSQVTTIGQRAMSHLKAEGLLTSGGPTN